MKNLVKLAAMAAVVFQAGAMDEQVKENDNLNTNCLQSVNKKEDSNETNSQLEYLRELNRSVYAILHDTTPDQAPEPTNEDLMQVQSEVDSILSKNSEDNMNEQMHRNNDPIQQAIDEALDIIQNEKVVRGDEDGKLYNLIQQQDELDPDMIRAIVEDLNQRPVDVRLNIEVKFDKSGQPIF